MSGRKRRYAQVSERECVACGSCAKVCPVSAISVYRGLFATVNTEKCVGCGKCSRTCPASIINIKEALEE